MISAGLKIKAYAYFFIGGDEKKEIFLMNGLYSCEFVEFHPTFLSLLYY